MSRRLSWSVRFFHLGLVTALLAGLGSAFLHDIAPTLAWSVMIAGALLAGFARFWNSRLRRRIQQHDPFVGFGDYPMNVLRGTRIMANRRDAI